MITPHLPPEQAANALLPIELGDALAAHGVSTHYVSHPFSNGANRLGQRRVTYVPRRGRSRLSRSYAGAVYTAARMAIGMRGAVRSADLVHLHGNGFIIEVGHMLARRFSKPCIITLYGTDVWDHDARRHARFARAVHGAAVRVFYSRGLLEFARPLGLVVEPSVVIYAAVNSAFESIDQTTRDAMRRELGLGPDPVLVTVKRLHPVAGHETLLRAVPQILRDRPHATFLLIGEGELRAKLEALARELGVAAHVRFLGRVDHAIVWRYYAAADVFVLPSDVESWGTVMLEALACGTPVVATDTPGGLEVREHFGEDVTIVEKKNPSALAEAVGRTLARHQRVSPATADRLRHEFSVSHCAAGYLEHYRRATGEC